ncbi:MAG: RluA family pseudouridine synthase [Clostridia bacterium]|nr:RluA family pseudouridine synthase [Clostridia bacterium]
MYRVLFENENLIVCEKAQGVVCEKDPGDSDSLIDNVRRNVCGDALLCHRLDRNTGGLIMLARNEETLKLVEDAQKEQRITKVYTAFLIGDPDRRFGKGDRFVLFKAFHFKDARKSIVYIYDTPRRLARPVETYVKRGEFFADRNITRCEIRLGTGRTHQIRAHMAHLGYPVAGDGKYGRNSDNKKAGFRYQALWASYIRLDKDLAARLGVPAEFRSEPDFC